MYICIYAFIYCWEPFEGPTPLKRSQWQCKYEHNGIDFYP